MMKQLSLQERDRRWANLRTEMAKEGIDVLVIQASSGMDEAAVKYVADSNYLCPGEDVIFPLEGEPIMQMHGTDWGLHCNNRWIAKQVMMGSGQIMDNPGSPSQTVRLAQPFVKSGKVGFVTGVQQYYGLRKAMEDAFGDKLVNANPLYTKVRRMHSKEEEVCITESARICDLAFHHVVDHCLEPGLLDYQICGDVMKIFREEGMDYFHMLWIEAGKGDHIGYRHAVGDITEAGSSMVIEFVPGINGFWGEIVFSLPIGKKLSAFMQKKYEIWQEAFTAGKAALKVGNRACDVAFAIEKVYDKYPDIIKRPDYGHSLGYDGMNFTVHDQTVLTAGMPVVLHPKVTDQENQGVFTGMHYFLREDGLEPIGGYDYETFIHNMIANGGLI